MYDSCFLSFLKVCFSFMILKVKLWTRHSITWELLTMQVRDLIQTC